MDFIIERNDVHVKCLTPTEKQPDAYRVDHYVSKVLVIKLSVNDTTITATMYNYLNELQENFQGDITFEIDVDGEKDTVEVQAVNGVATLEVDIETDERVVIRTINEEVTNDEVTING